MKGVYFCVTLLCGLLAADALPFKLEAGARVEDPDMQRVLRLVADTGHSLSQRMHHMFHQSTRTGLTTKEMKDMCEKFIEQYGELRDHIEDLREIAERNGTNIQTDIKPRVLWRNLDRVMGHVRVSPLQLLQMVFGRGSGLAEDSTRLSVSMAMLNQLSHMVTKEAYYNLMQADDLEEVQRSLDNILALGEAVNQVASGILDTVDDAEFEVELKGLLDSSSEEEEETKSEESEEEGEEKGWWTVGEEEDSNKGHRVRHLDSKGRRHRRSPSRSFRPRLSTLDFANRGSAPNPWGPFVGNNPGGPSRVDPPQPQRPTFTLHEPSLLDRVTLDLGNGWSADPSGVRWSNGGSTSVKLDFFDQSLKFNHNFQ